MRAICKTKEIGPGSVKRVEVDGLPPLADTCTHGKASLSEGTVEGTAVECPWHGGRFDVSTGQPVCLPATEPIATYPVTVVGDEICIGA